MSDLQDTLYEEFQQIQGAMAASDQAWSSSGSGGGGGGGQRDTAPRGDVDALGDQTGAIDYGGNKSASSSSSSGGILNDLGGALASGLGIVPLGLELASIFGGGGSTPPPLTRYAMPDSIGFIGSTDDSGSNSDADFGQMGQPRSYGIPTAQTVNTAPAPPSTPSNGGGGQSQAIQITVQAMDAQSFMDRSNDIASAVQKAISNLHPIVDSISNL
jgi:hypothetical protein